MLRHWGTCHLGLSGRLAIMLALSAVCALGTPLRPLHAELQGLLAVEDLERAGSAGWPHCAKLIMAANSLPDGNPFTKPISFEIGPIVDGEASVTEALALSPPRSAAGGRWVPKPNLCSICRVGFASSAAEAGLSKSAPIAVTSALMRNFCRC